MTTPSRVRRVLLVDEGWVQTLPLARALERAGFSVTVATANGGRDRIVRRTVTWESVPRVDDDAFLPALGRVMQGASTRAFAFDVVIPLTEPVMQRLWATRVPWSGLVFPVTTAQQRRSLRDKHVLLDELAAAGVPTPRQHPLLDPASVERAVRDLGFPLVLKGSSGHGGRRVWIASNLPALATACAHAKEIGGTWVLQEWAPGPTYLVGGVFDAGRALRLYAGEKLEQYPPHTGPAIRLRSTTDARVRALGQRVMCELGWTGMASVDLIARADGCLAVLEVNPRPWGSIAAASAAGVDLYAPFAALLRGEHPDADLACVDGDDCMVFPRYVLSPGYRGLRGVILAARDLLGDQGAEWRHPRFLVHVLRRLSRL